MPPDRNFETPLHLRLNREKELRKELLDQVTRLIEAEIKVVLEKMKTAQSDAAEAKKISLSARKHSLVPHECTQKEELKDMKTVVGSWDSRLSRIGISIISLLLVGGGGAASWWYSHAVVKTEVQHLKQEMTAVKSTVKDTSASLETFKRQYTKKEAERELQEGLEAERQLERIQRTIQSTLKSEIRRRR